MRTVTDLKVIGFFIVELTQKTYAFF